MTRNVDDKKLENLSGGTLDNSGVRDDREIPEPPGPPGGPIAAPVQEELENEAEGGGNVHFGR